MSEDYYTSVRDDLLPLLPDAADRVLEIGCGAGNTLAWLKQVRGCSWVGGIERHGPAAAQARQLADLLLEGDIEALHLPVPSRSLDLVLCLDVLEHLIDPWATVQRLVTLLRPGGTFIASLPNVRNRRVLLPLLLNGRWEYADSGLLDRTHLRFFTRSSAIALLEQGGLKVDRISETGLGRSRSSARFNRLLPAGIRSFFVRQYLLRGVLPGSGR